MKNITPSPFQGSIREVAIARRFVDWSNPENRKAAHEGRYEDIVPDDTRDCGSHEGTIISGDHLKG